MNNKYLPRKDSIVFSAVDIINDLGLHELSIRELAARQGVSEPALYRHFKSKQDIILAVLDYYSRYDSMIIKSVEEKKLGAKESILFYVNSFCEYYESYPAITAITLAYDILKYDPVVKVKIEFIRKTRVNALSNVIEGGKQKGEFSSNIDSKDFAHIILGTGMYYLLDWRMNKYNFSFKDKLVNVVKALLETV